MSGNDIVAIISVAMSLVLVIGGLRSHNMSFRSKAWMAAVWAVIIAVLAFVMGRIGA